MNATTIPSSGVVRFSGFLNHESQVHVNFNKKYGFYTGVGIKNIGIINSFESNKVHYKQSAYALTVPLALKVGKVTRQSFAAIGVEANWLFHYKEKFIFDKTKISKSDWFSTVVNPFNPAVFFQVKF